MSLVAVSSSPASTSGYFGEAGVYYDTGSLPGRHSEEEEDTSTESPPDHTEHLSKAKYSQNPSLKLLWLLVSSMIAIEEGNCQYCPTHNGLYPHVANCKCYFKCIDGVPVQKWCPPGQKFDVMTMSCTFTSHTVCAGSLLHMLPAIMSNYHKQGGHIHHKPHHHIGHQGPNHLHVTVAVAKPGQGGGGMQMQGGGGMQMQDSPCTADVQHGAYRRGGGMQMQGGGGQMQGGGGQMQGGGGMQMPGGGGMQMPANMMQMMQMMMTMMMKNQNQGGGGAGGGGMMGNNQNQGGGGGGMMGNNQGMNQGMMNQNMNQGMMNQGMNQGMMNQGMNQGMMNQGMMNQNMNQGMMNQGMMNQGMMNQGMMNQKMATQNMNQNMMNQNMMQQGGGGGGGGGGMMGNNQGGSQQQQQQQQPCANSCEMNVPKKQLAITYQLNFRKLPIRVKLFG